MWRARRARAAIILSASPRDAFSRARSLSLGVLHRLNPSSIYILCAHKFYADALAREISSPFFGAFSKICLPLLVSHVFHDRVRHGDPKQPNSEHG